MLLHCTITLISIIFTKAPVLPEYSGFAGKRCHGTGRGGSYDVKHHCCHHLYIRAVNLDALWMSFSLTNLCRWMQDVYRLQQTSRTDDLQRFGSCWSIRGRQMNPNEGIKRNRILV